MVRQQQFYVLTGNMKLLFPDKLRIHSSAWMLLIC